MGNDLLICPLAMYAQTLRTCHVAKRIVDHAGSRSQLAYGAEDRAHLFVARHPAALDVRPERIVVISTVAVFLVDDRRCAIRGVFRVGLRSH